jgi:hypothetical protein
MATLVRQGHYFIWCSVEEHFMVIGRVTSAALACSEEVWIPPHFPQMILICSGKFYATIHLPPSCLCSSLSTLLALIPDSLNAKGYLEG